MLNRSLEISGSDSVRRAREALQLLSRAIPFSIVVPRTNNWRLTLKRSDLLSFLRDALHDEFHQRRCYRLRVRLRGQIENLSQLA